MDKYEFLGIMAELIANNSGIEGEDDDAILLPGVEDVMENTSGDGTEDVTVLFEDGTVIKLTAEESHEEVLGDDV